MAAKPNDLIHRYQKLFDADPTSRIFAPLAEAYRKGGDLRKAFDICKVGVTKHPQFASGLVEFARVLLDLKEAQRATSFLHRAVQLSPDNILARKLLADLALDQKDFATALAEYKTILVLNPMDADARNSIQRLESTSAVDFEEFTLGSIETIEALEQDEITPQNISIETKKLRVLNKKYLPKNKALDRAISLIDALMMRNEFSKAKEFLDETMIVYGPNEEIVSRQTIIEGRELRSQDPTEAPAKLNPREGKPITQKRLKIARLEALLEAVRSKEL